MAKWVSLIVKLGALVFILFVPTQYAIQLQLLGGIWIIQTLPAMLIGLYTRWFNAWALLIGWAVGTAVGTWMATAVNFAAEVSRSDRRLDVPELHRAVDADPQPADRSGADPAVQPRGKQADGRDAGVRLRDVRLLATPGSRDAQAGSAARCERSLQSAAKKRSDKPDGRSRPMRARPASLSFERAGLSAAIRVRRVAPDAVASSTPP